MTYGQPSTIPALIASLLELAGDSAFADVAVIEGSVPSPIPQEYLSISGVNATQTWGPLGNRARNEEYVISFALSVRRAADEATDARDRVFVLLDRLAVKLRNKPAGIAFNQWNAEVATFAYEPFIDELGWSAFIAGQVHIQARI